MGDGRAPGHHISVELALAVAGQLEHAAGALQQRIEALARAMVGKARAVVLAVERKHRLQFPAKLERDFGGDLVGAVGDRRDEAPGDLAARELRLVAPGQLGPRALDERQHLAHAFAQRLDAFGRQHVGAVPGDADAQHERRARRARRLPRTFDLRVRAELASGRVQLGRSAIVTGG